MTGAARDITIALGGDWCGQYGQAPDLGHGPGDRGLKIWDAPELNGGVGVHSFHGYDWREVRNHLAGCGLLPEFQPGESMLVVDEVERRRRREDAEKRAREIEARTKDIAHKIWKAAKCAENSPVDAYLKSRAITLTPPPSLRFAPSLKHVESKKGFPAMVAAVQSGNGDFVGIHRTWLQADGAGKADIPGNKKMLGPCVGGAVRFAKPQYSMAIAEGVETALSFMQDTGIGTWAALSTTGLKRLELPQIVGDLIIAADRDDNGAGERAANDAAERWTREGRSVRIAFPPKPHKDFNDALRAHANENAK